MDGVCLSQKFLEVLILTGGMEESGSDSEHAPPRVMIPQMGEPGYNNQP